FWQRRFAGDPSVVGKKFIMNEKPLTVVGVMPPRFSFPRAAEMPAYLSFAAEPDAWIPRARTEKQWASRGNRMGFMLAKLKPGVSVESAEKELQSISASLVEIDPKRQEGWSVRLSPVVEQMKQGFRPVLLLLAAAGILVLLIACVNVINLFLARAASRQKEVALRTAIGAGRLHLVRQLLVESGILALVAGGLGVFLSWVFLRLCSAIIPPGLAGPVTFTLDGRALAFTLLLCVLSSLLIGLIPALQMTRPDLAGTLREGTRAGAGTFQSRRTRSALVVAEVAIAVVVLIGAGLLLRSFNQLMAVDTGIRPDNVLTFKIDMPAGREADRLASFYASLDQQLNSIPGVVQAGITSSLPMGGDDVFTAVELEGKPKPPPGELQVVGGRMVTPSLFGTLGIQLKEGRFLQAGDTRDKGFVAVIDESMAETYWPGEQVLGKRFKRLDTRDSPWITVVGVAKNVLHSDLYSEPRPTLYMTTDQTTRFFMMYQAWGAVRAQGDPRELVSAVRQAVYAVDREQPIAQVRTLEEAIGHTITKSRLSLLLLTLLAILALVLAMVGIYGITAYSVAQRTREIGLRMALGAQRAEVLRMVVRETGMLVLLGIVVGVGLAFALTRLATSYISVLLYQVQSTDPMTFVGVSLVLALVALVASYLPGRRATRVNPMMAMRTD
ncbi:MAG TPA: ABC transporter permease, partial [Thermoanaerobaculia bacterium]|nr:ABC transporter permease [Thermoanaerobaculia bacterium]